MAKNILIHHLNEPLGGARTMKVNIDPGDGNLTIDSLPSDEPVLACGELQYLENQGAPARSVITNSGQASLTVKASTRKQTWLRLPWAACNGATTWLMHLNPGVPADITAHSDGGNVRLDLASMKVIRVAADTGGGNMEVFLPDSAANLEVTAKTGAGAVSVEVGRLAGISSIEASSGAGTVAVRLPGSIAARIHATSGMGKVIMDPRFVLIEKTIYQSPDYDHAADKVEITLKSGAGNVIVTTTTVMSSN